MFCRKCGAPNNDDAYTCVRCGDALQPIAPKKIDNHMVLAIVVTLACCLPFGVVGIVHAAQVDAKARAGDIAGAELAAKRAKQWSLWGLGIGLAAVALYVVLTVAGLMASGGWQ